MRVYDFILYFRRKTRFTEMVELFRETANL
jgi:hypothetical protein